MTEIKNILIPGGLGYVGSHTIIHIIQQTKANVVIINRLESCFDDVLQRIKMILSKEFPMEVIQKRIRFYKGSILDLDFLEKIFEYFRYLEEPIDTVIHFAGMKAIGESMTRPLNYYECNFVGTIQLLKIMEKYKECKNFIFSSTAAVYGNKDNCAEEQQTMPINPYAQTKVCSEMLLASLAKVHPDWRIISLRFFNPCGAHESHLIGDEPFSFPTNLFPIIQEVIIKKRQGLTIFGNDHPTPDGTCIRDYIHITDLANGFVMALDYLKNMSKNYETFNLGSGVGFSVLQIVKGFEKVMGSPLNYSFGEIRKEEASKIVANIEKATKALGWKVSKTLEDMCRDSYQFIKLRQQSKLQPAPQNK